MTSHTLAALLALPMLAAAQSAPPPPVGANGPPRAAAPAVSTAPAMPGPPIRKIETATHVSTELLGAITGIRQLNDGRVLVNDGTRRRLLMFDSTLQHVTVVLDSVTDVENAYGTAQGSIIPYLGDSTLFIDRASYSMLLLDGNGKIARVRAVPTTNYTLAAVPGVDALGQLLFRASARTAPPPPNLPANVPYFPPPPDSAFIVRLNLNTRKLDTAGVIHVPKTTLLVTQQANGGIMARAMINPFPLTDDWTVLSDGTIAYVRGRDYRVEWQAADKTVTSSGKLAFDWVRMTDEDKVRMADSVKKVQADLQANAYYLQMLSWVNAYGQQYPKDFQIPPTLVFPTGMPSNWVLPAGYSLPVGYERGPPQVSPFLTPPAAPGAPAAATSAGGVPSGASASGVKLAGGPASQGPAPTGGTPAAGVPAAASASSPPAKAAVPVASSIPPMPTPNTTVAIAVASVVPADEWPDYKPPFAVGAARGDGDDNLWVRINLMHPIPGGFVYDVINRKGELFDRIQLPSGHTLVGFGAGGVVYLSIRDASGLHLERIRLR